MKKRIIILSVLLLVAAVIATFFLLPLKAWKAGETYNIGKDKIAYNPQTCTYIAYCGAYWKCKFLKETITGDNFIANGGELAEVTVTPLA